MCKMDRSKDLNQKCSSCIWRIYTSFIVLDDIQPPQSYEWKPEFSVDKQNVWLNRVENKAKLDFNNNLQWRGKRIKFGCAPSILRHSYSFLCALPIHRVCLRLTDSCRRIQAAHLAATGWFGARCPKMILHNPPGVFMTYPGFEHNTLLPPT